MKRSYLIKHWIWTLLIAPFMSQAIESFSGANSYPIAGLLEFYPITLLFSIVFSIPTFLFYLICFYFLSKRETNFVVSKFILIVVSASGIFITQSIIKGSMSQEIIIAYSVTSILVGVILRLRKHTLKNQDIIIET